jgi:hypothetical protein
VDDKQALLQNLELVKDELPEKFHHQVPKDFRMIEYDPKFFLLVLKKHLQLSDQPHF